MTELKPARAASQPPPSQPDGERSLRSDAPRDGHDVAAQLRWLTLAAHRAIRGEPGPSAGRQDLGAIRSAILDLEDAVARLQLNGLGDYVASLRRRVESELRPSNEDRQSTGANYSTRF